MKKLSLLSISIGIYSFLTAQTIDTTVVNHLKEVEIRSAKTINEKALSIGKISIKPMDLPQSVTIIDQTTIQNQQAQRLSDVIKNTNGIYLGGMRASTQETFYARGYNLGGNNTFKNGFRINSGTIPEMSSLESVEILKGSAALLYGNVAPGAIINMVTKKPKFDFGGTVEMRTGSFYLYKPMIDIYGPITKSIAYRLNGTYENTKSFRDAVHSERFYVNPSLLFNLTKKTTLLVQGDYLKYDFTPDFGIGTLSDQVNTIGGKIIPNVTRSTFLGAPWQYAKVKQATASFQLNQKLSTNWEFNILSGYQNYYRDYFSIERIQMNNLGDFRRPLGKNLTEQNYYTTQVFVNGNFNTGHFNHKAVTGIDFEQDNTTTFTSNLPSKAIYDTINIFESSIYKRRTDMPQYNWISKTLIPTTRIGAYIQDLTTLSAKVKVLVGIRWSFQQADKSHVTTLSSSEKKMVGTIKTDKAFSPRVGLVYQPNKTTALFTSYSNSFSPNRDMGADSSSLHASIIDQYELGIKKDFLNGLFSTNLTVYRIINNNLSQTLQFFKDGTPTNGNTTLRELSGQTTSDGIELDIRVYPLKGWDITAGYSLNNMRYTKTSGLIGSYVEGERLVNTPAHTANATTFYSFQTGTVKGLKLGIGIYYIGNRNAGWNNAYVSNTGVKTDRLFQVEGFTTYDISLGYTYKKWSLMTKLANITDTYNYYIHENYSINPIPPRNFIITAAFKF